MYLISSADVRQEIDAKRIDFADKKALEVSRDFIKLDSTYYLGWLYQGSGRSERAQDKFGYELAQRSYEKAIKLFEKDFKSKLKVKPDDIMNYIEAFQRQVDYTYMAYQLFTAYMATEEIDKAYALARKVLKLKMSNTIYFDPYNYLCWITHRARTSTSKKHSFLRDNVIDNERLALKYLDSSDKLIMKNYNANVSLFGENAINEKFKYNTYYRTIIYSYLVKADSAEAAFEKLKYTPHFSHNNYAYLKLVCGDFKNFETEFLIEKQNDDPAEKRTKEYNYMLSIANIYKGNPRADVDSLPFLISQKGEIPGFGWDNLALARSCYYASEHKKAANYLKVADNFTELHLNTTWSPEQYNYSISLLKYLLSQQKIDLLKFNQEKWFLNLSILKELPALYIDKIRKGYKYTNDFGLNQEREIAFYQLFNSECLITFDEIWKTIEQYNIPFFIKKYESFEKLENRKGVKRYYQYFLSKLHFRNGDLDKALSYVDKILKDPNLQVSHEKLLLARINELQAHIYKQKGDQEKERLYSLKYFELYPTLYQFSDLNKTIRVKTDTQNPAIDSLLNELEQTQIDIPATDDPLEYPLCEINLLKNKLILYKVSVGGNLMYQDTLKLEPKAGFVLANRIFGSQITDVELYESNNVFVITAILLAAFILWLVYYLRKRRQYL
ncbi:MAG: hypothetical protein U0V72_01145 [Cytophagales bacterium]